MMFSSLPPLQMVHTEPTVLWTLYCPDVHCGRSIQIEVPITKVRVTHVVDPHSYYHTNTECPHCGQGMTLEYDPFI